MNEIERADKAYEQSLDVPPSPYVWLMDSDFCMNCGTELADVDGYCWWCWEKREEEWNRADDEWPDEDEEVTYIGEYDQELYVMPKQTVIVDMEVEGEL